VEQGAGGFVFAPTMLTVKTGTSITVQNVGTTAHTFTITSTGIDITNDPGASKPVTINLQPGTYPFFCRFHVNLGMKGTLVVQN
jgi:plastocyanin